jgi:hypothetical protein
MDRPFKRAHNPFTRSLSGNPTLGPKFGVADLDSANFLGRDLSDPISPCGTRLPPHHSCFAGHSCPPCTVKPDHWPSCITSTAL